jgi:hypothetical protein
LLYGTLNSIYRKASDKAIFYVRFFVYVLLNFFHQMKPCLSKELAVYSIIE